MVRARMALTRRSGKIAFSHHFPSLFIFRMLARMRNRFRDSWSAPESHYSMAAWKRAAVGLIAVAVCFQFVRLTIKLRGDFDVHWESGRRILAGEALYARQDGQDKLGHNYPYPPFWALAHAPFALLPLRAGQLLLYPLSLVAGFVLLKTLSCLTQPHEPLDEDRLFLVAIGAIFLTSRFLVRDLPECGVNLALVALSWLAVLCWTRRWDWAGGWLLGLAISLKCTPALFWAWFVWKRQWKIAGTTLVAVSVLTLSPILLMGPDSYGQTMAEWTHTVWRGVGETDPAYGVLGEEPLQNISLRPALARYLTVLPAGHRSRVDHPLYADGLDLPPAQAGWIIRAVMLSLLIAVAYCFRSRVTDRESPVGLWEAAAVSVLILLLSPITWGQHCVGVLPVFYLLMRRAVTRKVLPRWTWIVLAVYVVGILLLNRAFLGKELTYLLDSYRISTVILLGLLAVAVRARQSVAEEAFAIPTWKSQFAKPARANSPAYADRELAASPF